jgi:4-hydroxy-3-methylbut-2-enyl diphosphate reductase IspH
MHAATIGQWRRWTSKRGSDVQFGVSETNRTSARRKRLGVVDSTGPTIQASNEAFGTLSLVNIEKIARGLKTTLPELFRRV